MSAPTGDRGLLWHPTLGDLTLWYPAFEVYAASSPSDNASFHGPHIAAPADLGRVRQAVQWLEDKRAAALESNPLPSLAQLTAELAARRQTNDGVAPYDDGSMCHMIWHWIHGDH